MLSQTNFLRWMLAVLCVLATLSLHADEPIRPTTYCNPISLPNYPIGRFARDLSGDTGPDWMWRLGYKKSFRELADVTALWHDNKWYLYPSVDMAWVSEDLGATWQHHPLNVRDLGYAPTVVQHKGRFYLMASNSPLYIADSPLGPFESIGPIALQRKGNIPDFIDPMLFSDSNERLYYYWGCSPKGGIWGVELHADHPTQVIGEPRELIPFDPVQFPWEAVGQWNQNPRVGWMEGAWMLKERGKYYLTYSAGGTENRTYAMGAYVSDSPLGPFVPQKRNPVLRSVEGLITGTAHGSIIRGPNDELWVFYSVRASVVHAFERRLGMDRAHIDDRGELFIEQATSLPQPLPSIDSLKENKRTVSWLPMNGDLRTIGSSNAPNLEGRFAVDNDLRTWWQPVEKDRSPTLTTEFMLPSRIHAVRLLWKDIQREDAKSIGSGPIRYRVELESEKNRWVTILDRSKSTEDFIVDYRECTPTTGTKARLTILEWPSETIPAVAEFTLFGETE